MKWKWLGRLKESWKNVPESNPPVWSGPRVDVPEEIKRRGIDCAEHGIDPNRVKQFQLFSNEVGAPETSPNEPKCSEKGSK